jgi:hypothetical protein
MEAAERVAERAEVMEEARAAVGWVAARAAVARAAAGRAAAARAAVAKAAVAKAAVAMVGAGRAAEDTVEAETEAAARVVEAMR